MPFMYLAQTTNGLFPGISEENKFWLSALVVGLFAGGFWLMNRNAEKWLDANGTQDDP
jgi:MFS-type transporter involved in bile tolerance (Atg22 family)